MTYSFLTCCWSSNWPGLTLAIGKYCTAHGDATLGGYIELIVDKVISRLPAQPAPAKPVLPVEERLEKHPPVAAVPAPVVNSPAQPAEPAPVASAQ